MPIRRGDRRVARPSLVLEGAGEGGAGRLSGPTTCACGAGTTPSEYITIAQVAGKLCMSENFVYELCDSGELSSVRFGRARRVERASVADYIRRMTKQSRSAGRTWGIGA